jgi:predicted nucleic acid-binding protein
MALILDTGPLVALLDATDPDHERCTALIQDSDEPRLVPVCVLVEVEYLLRPWPAAFTALLAELESGALELLDLPKRWLGRAGELLERYRDMQLGLVDATVLAATEMLGETKLATLDRRHFLTVCPSHCEALQLLPG